MPVDVPAIECRGLLKRFGRVEALRDLDLDVPRGVTFGLLGPNGAGKTTSIRLWLGLTRPTGGSASVLGRPLPPTDVLTRIGYMPQESALYGDLTVAENLALFGRLVGLTEEVIERRTEALLRLVDLDARRDDLVSTLSGGMKRRTSLATALVPNPDLLLLDEPTVGVDPELRVTFWDFFRRLTAKGKTVLITTHYMEEAAKCDLVGLLHRGVLLVRGTPSEVKERTGSPNLDDAFLRLVQGRSEAAG